MEDFNCESVVRLADLEQDVEMADVEMYDENHAFIANGFVVHNSNNEYKLEAHRDVGIRPLVAQFEDFVNGCLFPLMDEELSELCYVSLSGLDAETAGKGSCSDWAGHANSYDLRRCS